MFVSIEKSTGNLITSSACGSIENELQNAINCGFTEAQIEVKEVTDEEFKNILIKSNTKELTLNEIKQNKINELSIACNNSIVNGFYSDADGAKKLYDFELENQVNIVTKAYQVQLSQLAGQTLDNISYYTKGGECHDYTPSQFLKLAQDGEVWKTSNIQKYKDVLKPKVSACTTADQVNAVTWDGDVNATQTTI